eukprot:GHVH01002665.1.p1 GENE.GHVH01002665.1~~GHVH01002665.1.p1  ORF type:complete len:413 (-),score=48.45 GHVH01002665.1:266-1504(-)
MVSNESSNSTHCDDEPRYFNLNQEEKVFMFTSESVNEGHPDKICDQISDAILDAYLKVDPNSYVACETAATTNFIMVFGEINTSAVVDVESVVRATVEAIGYDSEDKGLDYRTFEFSNKLHNQSSEIAHCVHENKLLENIGAGDQGIMFGYATSETENMMPLTIDIANRLGKQLTVLRKNKTLSYLRPDGKTQVTMEYAKNLRTHALRPLRVHSVLISSQHDPNVSVATMERDLITHCIKEVIPSELLDKETRYYINPSGSFIKGGPDGDAGLTGRKLIVDTYGGWGAHGGGAFSGKDPSKVDRSGAYAARWVAKSLVSSGLCDRALVQLSYGIGISRPLSINVETYSTCKGKLTEADIIKIITKEFDLRPGPILQQLDLRKPIYNATAAYGHFGRSEFSWECPKDLSMHLK